MGVRQNMCMWRLQREVGAVEIQAQPAQLLRSHGSSSWAGFKESEDFSSYAEVL